MIRPLTIIVLVLSTTGAYCTEPVRLCYNPPLGSATRYEATSTLGQSLTVMGREVISEVSTTLGLTVTVTEKLLQRNAIHIAWSDGTLATRTIGNEQDSRSDTTIRVPTYGLTQDIVLTTNGTVISERTSAANQQQAEVLAMIRATKIPEHLFVTFPVAGVQPGFRWTQPIADTSAAPQGRGSVTTQGTAQYTYHGTIDTLGKRCWVIEMTSDNLSQHGLLYGAAIAMHIDGSGNLHGISYLDAHTGMLLQSRSQLVTQVVMSSTDQGNNVTVPVHSQVNILINRAESKGW